MANTTSCYQSVSVHWQPGPLPLTPSLPVLLLQHQQDDQPSALQAIALLALVWGITSLLPKQQGRQHFKTSVLKWVSGTDLLLCMLGCIVSLGTNGINVANITNNLPMLSGSLFSQALQLIRLTMMAWSIQHLYGSHNNSNYDHQEKRKISTKTQRKSQTDNAFIFNSSCDQQEIRKMSTTKNKSETEGAFILDCISKSLDKFIIFAVLLASVILFVGSVLYLAVKPVLICIHKSHFYKLVLNLLKQLKSQLMNLVKQLKSQMTVSLAKHPLNRKLMFLVPISIVISACVSCGKCE